MEQVLVDLRLPGEGVVGIEPDDGARELLQEHDQPPFEALSMALDPIVGGDVPVVVGRHQAAQEFRIDLRFVMEADRRQSLTEILDLTEDMKRQIELLKRASGN